MDERPKESIYSSSLDIEHQLINLVLQDVSGTVEPSKFGDCHNYRLLMTRQGAVDMAAHLMCTIFALDCSIDHESPSTVLEDVQDAVHRILEKWREENKEVEEDGTESEPTCEVCGDRLPKLDGEVSESGEAGLQQPTSDSLPVS